MLSKKSNQQGIMLLECLCVLSFLGFIIMSTQPVWQLLQREHTLGRSLAMVQAVLPILATDVTNSDRCLVVKQTLRLEEVNSEGNVSGYIEYSFANQQLIRKKNGGYERVGVGFGGDFQASDERIGITFNFTDETYRFHLACSGS